MARARPAPLEETQAEYAVVVKNTFLEVSGAPADGGLLTAPASFVGSLRRSLSETPKWQLRRGASTGLTSDGAETETTASTPSHESVHTAAAAAAPLCWPPTPASPSAPVRISLVELTLGEGAGSPASAPPPPCLNNGGGGGGGFGGEPFDAAALAGGGDAAYDAAFAAEAAMMASWGEACHQQLPAPCTAPWELPLHGPAPPGDASCLAHQQAACGWDFQPLGALPQVPTLPSSSLDLPPPPGSPKLPMHFQVGDSEPTTPPPAQDPTATADAAASQVFACVANARAPKCAPPCAPAPPEAAAAWARSEEAPTLPPSGFAPSAPPTPALAAAAALA